MRRAIRLLLPLALVAALAPVVWAGTSNGERFTAQLSGANEVPPVVTPATGQANFRLNNAGMIRFTLFVNDITNVVQSHIHCGAAGVNGPVRVFLFGPVAPGGGPVDGALSKGTFDPDGLTCTFGTMDVPLLQAMRDGNTYVNVHTDDGVAPPNTGPGDFPGGEIRGQITLREGRSQ